MIKKKIAKRFGAAGAAALVASMGMVPFAVADNDYTTVEGENFYGAGATGSVPYAMTITQTTEGSSLDLVTDDVHTITVAKTLDADNDGTNDTGASLDGPVLGTPVSGANASTTGTVTITPAGMIDQSGIRTDTTTLQLPVISGNFTHAGLYEYIINETVDRNSTDATGWTEDTTTYVLRIYIRDDNGTLSYDGVTLAERVPAGYAAVSSDATYDANTTYYSDSNGTANATIVDQDSLEAAISAGSAFVATPATEVKVAPSDGLQFEASRHQAADLVISNSTVGTMADRTHEFPMTVTLNIPSWYEGTTVAFTTTGTTTPAAATTATVSNHETTPGTVDYKTATVQVSMAHGDTLSFANLPVGTTYSVVETPTYDGALNYEVTATGEMGDSAYTADVSQDQTESLYGPATIAQDTSATPRLLTVMAAPASPDGDYNTLDIVNTLDTSISATGFAIEYTPIAVIVGGVLVAIVVLGASSSRRRSQREDQ